ncbi:MAG TPA: M4 family metallopeptidase [Archangium sp.]|uniref:M4 family metallopeptidase n=1 Tax=Archangium sp. TaxID=1872627 RepID=UPI002EDB2A24
MVDRFLLTTCCALWAGLALTSCSPGGEQEEGSGVRLEQEEAGTSIHTAMNALGGRVRVLETHRDGTPAFIKGELGQATGIGPDSAPSAVQRGMRDALSTIAPLFQLRAEELVLRRVSPDEQGHLHLLYDQTQNGLEVVYSQLRVHLDETGRVYAVNGSAGDGARAPVQPRISAEAAASTARASTDARGVVSETPPRLVYARGEDQKPRLAYEVRIRGEQRDGTPVLDWVYVDAEDGSELLRNPQIHTALNRMVHSANMGTTLPGTLQRGEGGVASGDAHADVHYEHLGTTYQCYSTLFGRDSYDRAGAPLTSSVHYSINYVDAFWNGQQLVYGDGYSSRSGPLGMDLDVTVHELTHAVTDFESDLIYSGESGALNESLSDIFAAVCESWSRAGSTDADVWKIGEDIWTPTIPNDALRYMANPTQDGSSTDYYPERYTGSADNGGVHRNSGIANLAFYLLSQGGTHPRGKTTVHVPGIGLEKAARIFYKANTDILTASTQFAGAKTATEQAAQQLGYDAATVAAVTKAWEAVGVGVTLPPPPTTGNALTSGVETAPYSGIAGTWKCWTLQVPTGRTRVVFNQSAKTGSTGDAELYVRFGSAPSTTTYDCRPHLWSSTESCTLNNPSAGTWHVCSYGYLPYTGVAMKGTY